MEDGLSGGKIIEQVYARLCERLGGEDIELSRRVRALISDDSDHHKTRQGFVKYASARIVEVNESRWALLQGTGKAVYGYTPLNDLLFADLRGVEPNPEAVRATIQDYVGQNTWFARSVCWSDEDWGIKTVPRGGGLVHLPGLAQRIDNHARQHECSWPELTVGGASLTLRSGVYEYSARLVPALTDCLVKYLGKPKED